MFASIWLILGASNWWRRLTGSLSAVADWVGQSGLHVLLAALMAALAMNLWQWHDRDALAAHDTKRIAVLQQAVNAEQGAFNAEQQVTLRLRAAVDSQNASIERLTRAGQARVASARAALDQANARDGRLDNLAARIAGATRGQGLSARAGGAGCRTPEAVMAARDVL